jgi:hypothetical protein
MRIFEGIPYAHATGQAKKAQGLFVIPPFVGTCFLASQKVA